MEMQAGAGTGDRIHRFVQDGCGLVAKLIRRPAGRHGVFLGPPAEGRIQARAGRAPGYRIHPWLKPRKGIGFPQMPEAARDLFDRRVLRQLGGVQSPIEQSPAGHHGHRRQNARLAPGRCALSRHQDQAVAPRCGALSRGHSGDVIDGIQAAPGVGGIGPGRNPAPADIGVEGLGLDAQARQRLASSDPAPFGVHVPSHRLNVGVIYPRTMRRFDDHKAKVNASNRVLQPGIGKGVAFGDKAE